MAPTAPDIAYDGPEVERVYENSLLHWQKALVRAKSLPDAAAPASLHVECVLNRTPCLPSTLPRDIDSIKGFTTWKSMSKQCQQQKQEPEESFCLRQAHRIICTVSSSHGFANWDGTPHNGVALLVLGWAYIFGASLAERQSLAVEYGELLLYNRRSSSPSQAVVYLEYASPDERLWWKAVTSQGVGWSIAGDQHSPWGVHVGDIGLIIGDASDDEGNGKTLPPPPTARQAAQYLARLCAVYQLGRQCSAALAAVLTFPLHASKHFQGSATISLPQPRLPVRVDPLDTSRTDFSLPVPDEFEHLGYYMALSLSPRILGPSLWSIFWVPDVPCNLAGAWVQPAVSILQPILADAADLELLAKVLSFTRAAPLWLGVALCGYGRVVKSILPYLQTLSPFSHTIPSMTAAAWTGLPSSFFHVHSLTTYVPGGMVSRAQVWRLRHDFHTEYTKDEGFYNLPPYGWPPFGQMREEDVELQIRRHLACKHRWAYKSYTWLLGKTDNVVDAGFIIDTFKPTQVTRRRAAPDASQDQQLCHRKPVLNLDNIRELSEKVTKSVFCWSCTQVEFGFGGTVVARLPDQGRTEKPHSPERSRDFVDASVNAWLRGIRPDDAA
ncbi:hypothetical protein SEUCBS140593_009415 [Sporothrix eucalyptigena]|uniref:Uncharacterized protein n=1 Tax=Sporothrix eucalyptigena TaxID=1812306 RepID=A0ABP0CUP4_9PEZI